MPDEADRIAEGAAAKLRRFAEGEHPECEGYEQIILDATGLRELLAIRDAASCYRCGLKGEHEDQLPNGSWALVECCECTDLRKALDAYDNRKERQ